MKVKDYFYELAVSGAIASEEQLRDLGWLFLETLKKDVLDNWEEEEIDEENALILADGVERIRKGEPIAYILGATDFYWCNIGVTPAVLIPRPETERLCEIVAKQIGSDAKVLDLCTGSGCIAIALKKAHPKWQIYASDRSFSAVKLASENARRNNVDVKFIISDMWQEIRDKYDIIVSNPPYLSQVKMDNLPKSVADYEPHEALFGGEDGLDFYRDIAKNAPNYLNENGRIYLEVGDEQAWKVAELLQENFTDIEIQKDLFDKERYVFARRK